MFELEELKKRINERDYIGALQIIDELDAMYLEDKINKIYNYIVVLLVHLIKQKVENRTCSIWDRAIYNSANSIHRISRCRKSGDYYIDDQILKKIIDEAYLHAIYEASYEVLEGKLDKVELDKKVERNFIKTEVVNILKNYH